MSRWVFLALISVTLARPAFGQVAPPPLGGASEAAAPSPTALVVGFTVRKPAGFKRIGLAGGFALLGVAAMYAEGADLVQKYHLQDPAGRVARNVAEQLAHAKSGRVADGALIVERGDAPSIARIAGDARYVVDVQTVGWGLADAHLGIQMTLRVVDVDGKRVVATSRCLWAHKKTDDQTNAPKFDPLDHDALGLKTEIEEAIDACTKQFWTAAASV